MISAVSKYILGFACMALLLFPAAGDWVWFNDRIFMGLLFVPMFILMLFYPALIVGLLLSEENFLEKELSGYGEYKMRVRRRLFPGLW